MTALDLFDDIVDDASVPEMRVGQIGTVKGMRIPLGTYVGVKVQKIHEDGDLMALAIWELGGGAVMPLGAPMGANA